MCDITPKLPVKVSSLIKATRWSFFLSGVFYGANKKRYLTRYDKPLKIIRKKQLEENIARSKIEEIERLEAFKKELASKF